MSESPKPIFIPLRHVQRIHRRSLEEHGGMDGVRDEGAVSSALAAALNVWGYGGDLFDIAAAYAFHLAESQAYIDGNKRTAIATALHFLAINGVYRRPSPEELHTAMIKIACREMNKSQLAEYFRAISGRNS
jgi:death on curing protein